MAGLPLSAVDNRRRYVTAIGDDSCSNHIPNEPFGNRRLVLFDDSVEADRNGCSSGGGGFIGSHTAAYYDRKRAEVTALDNPSPVETLAPEDNPVVVDMEGGPDNTTILVESLDLLEDRTGKRPSAPFDDRWEADLGVYVSQINRSITASRWELRVSWADGIEPYLNWDEAFA